MWKLIDMPDEEFSKLLIGECVYREDNNYCPDYCSHTCCEGYAIWLSQEHKEGDCQ
jgi:hypothetical protein